MKVVIDFDGTCVSHDYPRVGADIGAVPILKEIQEQGHHLILFTMRSGEKLQDAVDWFIQNDIMLYGIQTDPDQFKWTESPKAYGHLYIDDAALGIPLKFDKTISDRPFVNWVIAREMLVDAGFVLPLNPDDNVECNNQTTSEESCSQIQVNPATPDATVQESGS